MVPLGVGVLVIVLMPLYSEGVAPEMVTLLPVLKPCATEVVTVAVSQFKFGVHPDV